MKSNVRVNKVHMYMWDSFFFIDFTSCQLSKKLYGVRKLEITRTETGKKKSGTKCASN